MSSGHTSDIQQKIFEFIIEYSREQGMPPTNREIGGAMKIASTGHVDYHLKMLEKKGLIERPFRPLSGLGKGRITAYGIDVVEKTTSPPLSILFQQQHIKVQDSSDVQIATGNMQNVSDIEKMNTAIDHSQASQDAPKSFFERISKLAMRILKKFGLNV